MFVTFVCRLWGFGRGKSPLFLRGFFPSSSLAATDDDRPLPFPFPFPFPRTLGHGSDIRRLWTDWTHTGRRTVRTNQPTRYTPSTTPHTHKTTPNRFARFFLSFNPHPNPPSPLRPFAPSPLRPFPPPSLPAHTTPPHHLPSFIHSRPLSSSAPGPPCSSSPRASRAPRPTPSWLGSTPPPPWRARGGISTA